MESPKQISKPASQKKKPPSSYKSPLKEDIDN